MAEELAPTQNTIAPVQTQSWPVSQLDLILQACNPNEALQPEDKRYTNLKALRNNSSLEPFQRVFSAPTAPNQYSHCLLCGHRGSGKSTELLQLKQWADQHGYLAVRREVNAEFGLTDLDFADLYLLAAIMTEEAMQQFGKPLPEAKVRQVVQWFEQQILHEHLEEVKSEIGIEAGVQLESKIPLLGGFLAKFRSAFTGTSKKTQTVRDNLRKSPETLIAYVNDLLSTANAILSESDRPRGVLLIFDNMDRYDPVDVDRILVRNGNQTRLMACHAIFTFPITLAYKPITGQVPSEYSRHVVLPMMALRRKDAPWAKTVKASRYDTKRIAEMLAVLKNRIDVDALFVNPKDVELLVRMSGGAIRDLIKLVSLAATYTEDDRRITSQAVQSAIQELRGDYMRLLATTPHDYRCLAAIACRQSVSMQEEDFSDRLSRLLFNGCLLEYTLDGQPWHDVHPVLVETEEFRHACDALDQKADA